MSTESSEEVVLEIADAFPHPDYNTYNNEFDIAMVQLSRSVNYTDYIKPICLATSQVEPISYYSCYIAGWGAMMYDGKLFCFSKTDNKKVSAAINKRRK